MDKYVMDIRIQQWAKIIQAANDSGLPRAQWLAENGITRDAFYYWQKKVRTYYAEQSGIINTGETALVEVPVVSTVPAVHKQEPAAVINVGAIKIEVSPEASAVFMENLGRMIRNAL